MYSAMNKLGLAVKILLVCSLAVGSTACAKQPENDVEASYTRLCKIYKEVGGQQSSTNDVVVLLGTRLRNEVPELREVNRQISSADPRDVYDLYKQSAEYALNKPWSCPAIKRFYQSN